MAPDDRRGAEAEEVRVDPADGQPRTFGQLRAACAGTYSAAEVEAYWDNSCRPHVDVEFEGAWRNGRQRNVIEGAKLYWHIGIETDIQSSGPGSLSIQLDGRFHSAELSPDGRRLAWSDGDVWTRCDDDVLGEDGGWRAASEPDFGEPRSFCAGDRVKYWSSTASKWIAAVVRGQNQDGTYELDVKKRAGAELLRPMKTGPGKKKGVGLEVVRWRMQLPRALAEWQAGEPGAFERLLEARVENQPGQAPDRVLAEMLKDALAACSSLGFSTEELEEALALVKDQGARRCAPDANLEQQAVCCEAVG